MIEDRDLPDGAASLTAAERLERCIGRIEAREPSLKAFCHLDFDAARREALRLDALPPSERGLCTGVPIGIKEVFDAAGLRCAWGTPIHAGRVPAKDADAVARLRSAGAVIVGTTTRPNTQWAPAEATVNPL
ncbi:MAG: amidase, partial [Rhodomicrobium sp.]|nr:amidase [Rhodomicrobium sp.]